MPTRNPAQEAATDMDPFAARNARDAHEATDLDIGAEARARIAHATQLAAEAEDAAPRAFLDLGEARAKDRL